MKEALVLMAKAPIEGQVKTRLIGEFSPAEATELYAAFLSDTFVVMEDVVEEREALSLVLCYTPFGEEEAFEKVEREGSMMLAQRGEDLGERLRNCFADLFELGFDSVVAIGADSPTLPGDYVFEAFERLIEGDDVVIGPAEDQGYYLIGMKKLHERIFHEIPWSTPEALSATQARAQEEGLKLSSLPVWYDVDTPGELERLKQELGEDKDLARFTRKFLKNLAKNRAQS